MKILSKFVLFSSLFILGCGQEAQTQSISSADSAKFNSVESYQDLLALDSSGSLIKKMESDDARLDIEDSEEIKSGKNKILIVGDSWATFPCFYGSLRKALNKADAKIINDSRCLRTSKLGAQAKEWRTLVQHQRTLAFIKANSRIKFIYLTLGGNDLMAEWNKDYTVEQEKKLFEKTFSNIKSVMNDYLAARPDLKIILSGYDFPHFKDKHPIKLYRRTFENMGKPDHSRLNKALIDFTLSLLPIADGKNIFYIHHLGLSQYIDGVPEFGLKAGKTKSPEQISSMLHPEDIGGDANLPSSRKSMINWLFLVRDAFHLQHDNYVALMKHTYDNLLVHLID